MTELPGMEETYNDELSKAVHNLKKVSAGVKEAKDKLETAKDLVVIEMKKIGKDFLGIQLDGEFWEVEVKRAKEKLYFARLKK